MAEPPPCPCGCPDPEEWWCNCGPLHDPDRICVCGPGCWFCNMPTRQYLDELAERAKRGLSPYHPGGPCGPAITVGAGA